MNKQDVGTPRWMSLKWRKEALVLIGMAGIICLAMWLYKKGWLVQGQSELVINVCYLALIILALLLFIHFLCPGSLRWLLAMVTTAMANRNREAIPPKKITDHLGIDDDVIDKSLVKVSNTEMCSEQSPEKSDFSIEVLRKVAPQMSSLEEFFDEVSKTGAKRYYPILRQLIKDEDKSLSSIYRVMYELVSDTDRLSYDADDPKYRKGNLKWLIGCEEVGDKWRFYCSYIDLCYRDEEYDQIVECAQGAISSIDDADSKCHARRAYVYVILGSIYLERKQYNYAIPYFKEAVQISKIRVPSLFRLAYIYCDLLCDYKQGLHYAQLCFLELSDSKNKEMNYSMEYNLIRWIAYCSAACGEYTNGCTTLENYLTSASARVSKGRQTDIESCLTYLLIKDGKWDEAHELSKKVLCQDPMNITAVNVKGMWEMRHKHFEVAINCFSKIIPMFEKEKAPQAKYYLGEVYNNLAICEAKLGRKSDADKHFRAAFDCDYPDIDISQFAKVANSPLGLQNKESVKDKSSSLE